MSDADDAIRWFAIAMTSYTLAAFCGLAFAWIALRDLRAWGKGDAK